MSLRYCYCYYYTLPLDFICMRAASADCRFCFFIILIIAVMMYRKKEEFMLIKPVCTLSRADHQISQKALLRSREAN